MDPNEELLGADLMEHRIRHSQIGLSRALSALQPLHIDLQNVAGIPPIGMNPRHEEMLQEIRNANDKINQWHAYYDKMSHKKSGKSPGRGWTPGNFAKGPSRSGHLFSRRNRKNQSQSLEMNDEVVAPSGTFTVTNKDLKTVSSSVPDAKDGKDDDQKNDINFAWVD